MTDSVIFQKSQRQNVKMLILQVNLLGPEGIRSWFVDLFYKLLCMGYKFFLVVVFFFLLVCLKRLLLPELWWKQCEIVF